VHFVMWSLSGSLLHLFCADPCALCLGVGFVRFRSFGFGVSEFRTISGFGWQVSEFLFRSFGVLVLTLPSTPRSDLRVPWLVVGLALRFLLRFMFLGFVFAWFYFLLEPFFRVPPRRGRVVLNK